MRQDNTLNGIKNTNNCLLYYQPIIIYINLSMITREFYTKNTMAGASRKVVVFAVFLCFIFLFSLEANMRKWKKIIHRSEWDKVEYKKQMHRFLGGVRESNNVATEND